MDIQTIDQNYQQLQQQSQQTVQAIAALAQKMQAAASEGDQQAREWLLDLKEITLAIRDEQRQGSRCHPDRSWPCGWRPQRAAWQIRSATRGSR